MTNRTGKRIRQITEWNRLTRLVLLSICFILGAVGGFLFSASAAESGELRTWLTRRFQFCAAGEAPSPSLPAVLWDVFRWPAAVFLLGFTPLGIIGIPGAMAARGFLLSFAVSVFVRLFGVSGAVAALTVFSVSLFLVLPSLFVLALASLEDALCVWENRSGAVPSPADRFLSAIPCIGLLALATALQKVVVPALMTAVCAGMFP